MKSRYKRLAYYNDDNILLSGYVDKRGFHPYDLGCGFGTQGIRKRDIGVLVFYNLDAALKKYPNIEIAETHIKQN